MSDPHPPRPLDDALRLLPDPRPREPLSAERRAALDRRRGRRGGVQYVVPSARVARRSTADRAARLATADLLGELGKCAACGRPMSLRGPAHAKGPAACSGTCRELLRHRQNARDLWAARELVRRVRARAQGDRP